MLTGLVSQRLYKTTEQVVKAGLSLQGMGKGGAGMDSCAAARQRNNSQGTNNLPLLEFRFQPERISLGQNFVHKQAWIPLRPKCGHLENNR